MSVDVRERFERDTADHELTVLRDDGLYRHLRVQKPGTYMYGFDLVTWPGYLAIVGDCGDYVFSRIDDMVKFFESGHGGINPHYWSEKLQGQAVEREFSYAVFRRRVLGWADDACDERWGVLPEVYPSLLKGALEREILDDGYLRTEDEARERLGYLEQLRLVGDTWEWELRDYTWSFLWCCWAIVRGIELYRASPVNPAQAVAA